MSVWGLTLGLAVAAGCSRDNPAYGVGGDGDGTAVGTTASDDSPISTNPGSKSTSNGDADADADAADTSAALDSSDDVTTTDSNADTQDVTSDEGTGSDTATACEPQPGADFDFDLLDPPFSLLTTAGVHTFHGPVSSLGTSSVTFFDCPESMCSCSGDLVSFELGPGVTWPLGTMLTNNDIVTVDIEVIDNGMGPVPHAFQLSVGSDCNTWSTLAIGARGLDVPAIPGDLLPGLEPYCIADGTCSDGEESGEYQLSIAGEKVTQLDSVQVDVGTGPFIFHNRSSYIDNTCNQHVHWAALRVP